MDRSVYGGGRERVRVFIFLFPVVCCVWVCAARRCQECRVPPGCVCVLGGESGLVGCFDWGGGGDGYLWPLGGGEAPLRVAQLHLHYLLPAKYLKKISRWPSHIYD